MSEFKSKFFDKERNTRFLDYYWRRQMENLMRFSVIVGIFGVLSFIFVVPIEHANYPLFGYIKYAASALGDFGFALFAWWLIRTTKYEESKKAHISQTFSFIFGIINMLWGIYATEVSFFESGTRNSLIILIIMAILTSILYYPLLQYLYILLSSAVILVALLIVNPSPTTDATSVLCTGFMMVLLFNLGITRYLYGRDRFEVEKHNDELISETEAQNEELTAGNEELTAINEELNSTTDKLSQALAELEKSSQAQKMFTNSMNHELRAPLNGIIGNLQIMLKSGNLTDDIRGELEECMSISGTMLGIVNELLDFAKMDAGELKIIPEDFDLHNIINNVNGMFKNIAREKGLVYITEIPYDMVCGLYGDDVRIQQVLTNIVSNAVKYTNEGFIKVTADYSDSRLIFKVTDSGQGMSEESVADLFTPYRRFEEGANRKIQGTGLGMSIVKHLVDLMDGTIEVESVLKKGSTFTIAFPVQITDASNTWKGGMNNLTPANRVLEQHTPSQSELTGLRILYVDDTAVNLKIITGYLADTGASLTCCQDSVEGLEKAINDQYDLMLIDHRMPQMDGPELLTEIRNRSVKNASTPAIIFTGNGVEGVEDEYHRMGFAGYVLKPVLRDDLIKMIVRHSQTNKTDT